MGKLRPSMVSPRPCPTSRRQEEASLCAPSLHQGLGGGGGCISSQTHPHITVRVRGSEIQVRWLLPQLDTSHGSQCPWGKGHTQHHGQQAPPTWSRLSPFCSSLTFVSNFIFFLKEAPKLFKHQSPQMQADALERLASQGRGSGGIQAGGSLQGRCGGRRDQITGPPKPPSSASAHRPQMRGS